MRVDPQAKMMMMRITFMLRRSSPCVPNEHQECRWDPGRRLPLFEVGESQRTGRRYDARHREAAFRGIPGVIYGLIALVPANGAMFGA